MNLSAYNIKNESMMLLCQILQEPSICKTINGSEGGSFITINDSACEQFSVANEKIALGLTTEEFGAKNSQVSQEHIKELMKLDTLAIKTATPQVSKVWTIRNPNGSLHIQKNVQIPLFSDSNSKKVVGIFSTALTQRDLSALTTLQYYISHYKNPKKAIYHFLNLYNCVSLFMCMPTFAEVKTLIYVSNLSRKEAAKKLQISVHTISSNIERIKNKRLINELDINILYKRFKEFKE